MKMSNKPWERPWTTEEIVENASNWNLGADVGLLKHLEQFSEDLLRKANTTNNNLNNLLQNLTNASLSLDIARNEFLSLSNTQFIESRVYEDDETLPAENEQNVEEKKQNEDDRIKDMKLAVMTGLEVLDKYFDKIEVPASDSEDETDCPSFVLRPKDPYLDRPLPYIIGSEEWHKKWHVGLEESSSDSETEKVSEKFSDTDSESDLPVVNRQAKSVSESGSEADLSNRMQGVGPVANSTFNDTNKHFFGSSSSEEFNSVSAQAPISQNNFAEQLAAKLGNVIAHNVEVPEPEVNKRPIQKTSGIGDFSNLFSSEPPPLDDADDLFGAKPNQHGVFSGGDGLFDDLDNDVSFWGEKKDVAKQNPQPQEKAVPNLFDEEEDEEDGAIFTTAVQPQPKQEAREEKEKKIENVEKRPRGLFDDDGSDDDIFNTDKLKKKLESITQKPPQPAESLFDEEPPPLITNGDGKTKVPVGGVSVLARHDLQKALKTRQYSSESSDSDRQNLKRENEETKHEVKEPSPKGNEGAPPKELFDGAPPKGLFDQRGDELFDDLFSEGPSQKKFSSGGLFDDEFENPKLFESPRKGARNQVKPLSLFDDDDDDFFAGISATPKQSKPGELSADDSEIIVSSAPKETTEHSEELPQNQTVKEERQALSLFEDGDDDEEGPVVKEGVNKTGRTLSLFDDDGAEEDDDLFLITPKTPKQKSETPQRIFKSDGDLFKEIIKIEDSTSSEPLERSKAARGNLFEEEDVRPVGAQTMGQTLTFDQSISEVANPNLKNTATSNLFAGENGGKKSDPFDDAAVGKSEEAATEQVGPPVILFDPTPPPDLENWDTRSENNLFEDDIYSFDNGPSVSVSASGQRSSIFDVEPPSLLCNESSGIVRDQSARNETNDSSFFPYASSSRRLSTDLSHEDDSIFVTKTKNVIDSKLLHDIPEVSPQASDESFTSAVDLTPSGDVDDLYSEATTFTESISKGEEKTSVTGRARDEEKTSVTGRAKDEEKTSVTGRAKDEEKTSVTERAKDEEKTSVTGRAKDEDKTSVTGRAKDEEKTSVPGRAKDEEKLEKKPPVPKMKPQIQPPEKDTKEEKPKDGGGPGKLKHNLNINVRALLPGAALHRRNLEKSKSLDLSGDSEQKIDADILGVASDDFLKDSRANEASHSESNLYNPEGSVEVLQSITKDRARIPIRRRPSTKKGREAIRKSCIDFSALDRPFAIEAEAEEEKGGVPKLAPQSQSFLAELSKKLTDTEESMPPPIDVVRQAADMDAPNKSNQPTIAFDLDKEEEAVRLDSEKKEDLLAVPNFSGERRTSFVKTDNFESPDFKKSDLFDDEDNGDDIFSTKKLPPKSDMFKRSLFEDDDDDAEDIFGTPSAVTVKKVGVGVPQNDKSSTSRRPKSSNLKKLENKEVIFDPLDALNQN